MTSKRCHRGLPQKALLGPGFTVLNPWAQILEAQPFDGLGFAVLDPWAQILEAQPLVGPGFVRTLGDTKMMSPRIATEGLTGTQNLEP